MRYVKLTDVYSYKFLLILWEIFNLNYENFNGSYQNLISYFKLIFYQIPTKIKLKGISCEDI